MRNKIKLVQVIADSNIGGGPKHVLGILRHIDQSKFEPFLICPPGYLSAEGKLIKGVTVFNFSPRSKFDLISFFELRSIIQKIRASRDPFGPIIIHSHGPRAGLLARMASPSGLTQIYTEHLLTEEYHLKNPINDWIQKKILKKQNFNSSLIIAVSNSVKEFLLKNNLAQARKVVYIPNGINKQDTRYKIQDTNKSGRAPIIGAIGNLNFQKGHIYLIEAMPQILDKFPLTCLDIIGEGEERKILEDATRKLKIEHHVNFLGQKHDVSKYMKHWSIFAMPSISETFGISALEAMEMGIPVVASKVGGLQDIVTQNKSGILVQKENSKALASAIIEVLSRSVLSAKLRREGKERAKDFYWEKVIKKLEESYLETLRVS